MELLDLVPWAAGAGIAGLVGWIWWNRAGSDDGSGAGEGGWFSSSDGDSGSSDSGSSDSGSGDSGGSSE